MPHSKSHMMIYSHIEYKADNRYIHFGEVFIPIGHTLLYLLTGFRLSSVSSRINAPLFPTRGMPSELSGKSFFAWTLRVTTELGLSGRDILRIDAEKWVAKGASQWITGNFITDPDFHTPSWLITDELAEVQQQYAADTQEAIPALSATIAAMRELPDARFIFWFDSC